jgi:predicted HD superfamily hydrolase involved in NAD metabolism
MHVMGELAQVYRLDPTRAMTAGLLHDSARDLKVEHQLALAEEAGMMLSHPCERHPVYLHALVGAYLVSKELGITDGLILDAISTHSYAGNGDNLENLFSRCLRAADILAPIHEWKGKEKLRRVVWAGRMDEAALLQSGWLIEFFEQRGIPVHPNLMESYETLSAKLGVDDSFFERW